MTKLKDAGLVYGEFKSTFDFLQDFFSNVQMARAMMDNYLDVLKDNISDTKKIYIGERTSSDTVAFEDAYKEILYLLELNWGVSQDDAEISQIFRELKQEFLMMEKKKRDRLAFYFIIIDFVQTR